MEKLSNYQEVKTMLRSHAEYVKVQFRNDKPAIRQSINDYADSIGRDYNLSEYRLILPLDLLLVLPKLQKVQLR